MEFKSMPRRETCRYYQWESHASGFIIAAVSHVLLRSGLTLHILLLVLFFFLMQGVGRMMNSRRSCIWRVCTIPWYEVWRAKCCVDMQQGGGLGLHFVKSNRCNAGLYARILSQRDWIKSTIRDGHSNPKPHFLWKCTHSFSFL